MRSVLLALALLLVVPSGAAAGVLDEPPLLSCDGRLTFGPAALHGPTGAETADDPAASELRELIASRAQGPFPLPASGWRAPARTSDLVLFQHGGRKSQTAVTVGRAAGEWRVVGEGCFLRRAAPGHEVAEVTIHRRNSKTPRRSARTLRLHVLTGVCASKSPAERLRRVEVRETRRTVTLLALMEPTDADPALACPAMLAMVPAKVRLDRPLGRRAIRDASSYPAHFVARAR